MHIKFEHIDIEGFMSIEKGSLDLNNQGYVLINGINNNPTDASKSNGSGKCFGAGTKVLMYDGTEKPVEDIRVNDIVMGWDFTPRIVLETHTGIGNMYKVKSSKSDSYIYTCNEEHLLCLTNTCGRYGKHRIGEQKIISIGDYLHSGYSLKRYFNQTIPGTPCSFYKSPLQKTLISPYILGVWLGDGTSKASAITTMDTEIRDSLESYAKLNNLHIHQGKQCKGKAYTYYISANSSKCGNTFWNSIRYYNLNGNKHIPLEYLVADIETRFQLLAGIIDTDGYKTKNNQFEITLKRNQLSYDVVRLARSLGFKVLVSTKCSPTHKGIVSHYDRILISGEVWNIPVKLPRKAITKYDVQHFKTLHPTISSIGIGKYYGFQISGDGKFLLSDYTIVHNSSVIEAIVYALTGETIRGTKDIVNRVSSNGCKITLDFKVDNISYKIIRTKDYDTSGANLKLYVDGKDVSGKGIRDTQKILEEYLPDLTSSLIGSVIVLGQGLPQRFTNNTPSGRKEVLEKLSKSDFMIEDIKDKLSKRKIELNEELRKVEDIILSSTSKKEILDNQLVKLKNDKAILSCEADVDYDAEIKKYENSKGDLIAERDKKEYDRDLYKSKLDQKLQEYQSWVSKVHENYLYECSIIDENANIYQLSKENIELENKVKYKEEEIQKLESIKDICPTCGQHLPEVHKVDITPYKVELTALKEMFERHSKEFNVISETIEKAKKAIMDKFDKDTEEIKKEGQALRQFYDESVKTVNDLNKSINDLDIKIEAIKLNKQNYENKKDTIDKDIIDTENQIKQKDEEILYNNNEKNNIESRLQVVNKMITIATRDFRGFLLSEIIKYIDTKAKEYCLEVFGTDKINFVLDGNNISISYDGKEYENLSGGEKQRIDLIVQFSIRDMLCQFMNFSANLIALDEIFDSLDITSCQNVINMLSKKLNDIESIFIISHHLELDIPYDKQIFVVKNERGVSTIS